MIMSPRPVSVEAAKSLADTADLFINAEACSAAEAALLGTMQGFVNLSNSV